MEGKTENTGPLHDFYHHLGTIIIRGRDFLKQEQEDQDWVSILSKSGFPDLADSYENFLLTINADDLYRDGLLTLLASTGEKLRTCIREVKDKEELAYLSEYIQAEKLPSEAVLPGQFVDDISTLTHVLNVGPLKQKRAAAQAMANFLLRKKDPANKSMREEAANILNGNRDPEIAYEVTHALSFAPGSEGKKANAALGRARRFMARLDNMVVSYWDGLLAKEPIVHLNSEDIVTLGIWMRLASDYVVGHVGEILVNLLAEDNDKKLSSYIAAFIYSADLRLLPVFIRILQDGALASKIEAIKAIAHIDDPRSFGALDKAFRHSTDMLERIVLARALARMGSPKHIEFLKNIVKSEQRPEVLEEALKAMEEMEQVDDQTRDVILRHLDSVNPAVTRGAIRALSGIGNENDIETLGRIAEENPKMRAMVTSATRSLYSHIILRGKDIIREAEEPERSDREKGTGPGLRARMAAGFYYVLALIWLVFKRPKKILNYIGRSLQHNPRACYSHFLKAYTFSIMENFEMAIETYRQAVSIDANFTWRRPDDADRLIRTYLHRSEEIEIKMSNPQEAFLLLEELNEIDLRKADPNLKIEIGRRLDYLKYTALRVTESIEEE